MNFNNETNQLNCPNCKTYNWGYVKNGFTIMTCPKCGAKLIVTQKSRRHTVIHVYVPEHKEYIPAY